MGNIQRARPVLPKAGRLLLYVFYRRHLRRKPKGSRRKGVPLGYIQMRRSKDLVHWEFLGWAFPEIPEEAVQWVQTHADGKGATNIWAPYIIPLQRQNTVSTIVSPLSDARLPISDLLNPTPRRSLDTNRKYRQKPMILSS